VEEVLLLPLATGMALTMALLTMKEQKPQVDIKVIYRPNT
jgi:hypothetical protein